MGLEMTIDINYEVQGDTLRAVTKDGFAIVISAPGNMRWRRVDVWVVEHPFVTNQAEHMTLETCKITAEKMLIDFRALADHFREQGRAEVRAAQGELALAAFERGRDEGRRCTDRPALSTTGGTE